MPYAAALTGNSMLLQVNTGTEAVPVWATVGSQRDCEVSRSRDTIDVSSKDSMAARHKPGQFSYEISFEHLYVPGAAELALLRTAITNGVLTQVREFRDGVAVTVYTGTVTGHEESWPHDGEATVSCSFTGDNWPV